MNRVLIFRKLIDDRNPGVFVTTALAAPLLQIIKTA
jgi:hypothetical protein